MSSKVTVQPSGSRKPPSWNSRAHHFGDPPTHFVNPWPSFRSPGLLNAFKLRFGSNSEKNLVPVPQGPNGERSDELVRVRRPDWGVNLSRSSLKATWIGHAGFLIETPAAEGAERGIRILLDPVFSERTSPSQWFGPRRYTPTPCSLDELPDVDIVCISHNHYDHLDHMTVEQIYKKRKGHIHFFAPLGNKLWFEQHVCQPHEVTDSDWFDTYLVEVQNIGNLQLTCCPNQHASGRTPFDQGKTLWSGWAIESGGKRLYFSGDTAYQAQDTPSPCPAFKATGEALGPFDLALLPIGLMTPQSFMGGVHATPEQSLFIHREIKSKLSLGMHYGTFRGGISAHYEDVRDPPRRWRLAAEKEDLWCGGGVEGTGKSIDTSKMGVGLCDIGETIAV
ncbi:hypothetical protein M433DRAFT_132775 [Acidomyces richmondensis BFW]|nr:MAG: hypothetical protein FE78DRAFT_140720 [Acidomyces sp. 'richmondensis']KYG47641.1 hypothetical protein M433DRAFT_132775 [Acidomyces richmondensis BFW]